MEQQVKYVKKVSARDTLLSIPVGESRKIRHRIIKASTIRSTVRNLNEEDYEYEATEIGCEYGTTKVTRIK